MWVLNGRGGGGGGTEGRGMDEGSDGLIVRDVACRSGLCCCACVTSFELINCLVY